MQYIAFDSHKRYTVASVEPTTGGPPREVRIQHEPGSVRAFLKTCEPGSPVAIETTGNWYWIVDEIEAAGMVPKLVHARKAKLMFGCVNKTDKLDARGLNRLQRAGTLPTVWIPSGATRDARDLPRTRMVVVRQRTALRNRIQSILSKYGLTLPDDGDLFTQRGEAELRERIGKLPPHASWATQQLFEEAKRVDAQVKLFEQRIKAVVAETPEIQLLMTMPGIGRILGTVIAFEIGDVNRFPSAEHLASYAGTTPRVHSSGDKTRHGQVRNDVNRYLKWGFAEAANAIAVHRRLYPERHAVKLYLRLRPQKGHAKAVGAVSRHLAEAAFWVLKKREAYRDPKAEKVSSMGRTSASPS
jgi:transposase